MFEEYLANTVITSAIEIMFIPCFIGMPCASLETIEWLVSVPKILVATNKMIRHAEDLGSWEVSNKFSHLYMLIMQLLHMQVQILLFLLICFYIWSHYKKTRHL